MKIGIIAVDGMSEDRTRKIIRREAKIANYNSGVFIRLIYNPNGQRASGLNIRIREAKGDVVIRVAIFPKKFRFFNV